MKGTMRTQWKQAAGPLAVALAMTWSAGCGPSQPVNPPPPIEVRGEAINAPVQQPAGAKSAGAGSTAAAKAEETAGVVLPSGAKIAGSAAKVAPPTPPVSPEPKAPETATTDDGFLQIGFDKLASFNYEVPDGPVQAKEGEPGATLKKEQIPQQVKALDRKRVALQGFMLPLKVENGLITELLIMRDQSMCCYGAVPKINEWVSVKMTGKGVKPIMDQAVTMYGTLKVGEILENGYLVGIYEMDGERMAGPLDL